MKRHDVEKILMKLEIPDKIKGFKYIPDAVLFLDNGWYGVAMERVYIKIALKYDDNWKNVEWSIRHAFTAAKNHSSKKNIIAYLGHEPSNKNSIYHLYHILRARESEGGVA